MGEAHLAGHRQNLDELGMNRRLAAGELHHAAIHRTLVAQRHQHGPHLLHVRLVQVAGGVRVGKADRAGQVAAVGQIHVGQRAVRGVQRAESAIVRTNRFGTLIDRRIAQPRVIAELPLLHLQIESDIRVHAVLEIAVLRASLLHHHAAVLFKDARRDAGRRLTVRTQRGRRLRKPLLQRLNWATGQSLFRLQDFQVRPLRRCKWSAQGYLRSTVRISGSKIHSRVILVCLLERSDTVAAVTPAVRPLFSESQFHASSGDFQELSVWARGHTRQDAIRSACIAIGFASRRFRTINRAQLQERCEEIARLDKKQARIRPECLTPARCCRFQSAGESARLIKF